jgi:cell wall-associated NlpC family hydrolase
MTIDGIAAVQARIQEIQDQVGSALSPSTSATAGSTQTGSDFASLLSDAMNTQSAAGIGDTTDPASTTGAAGSTGSSGLLSDLVSSLTGSGATSGTSTSTATSPDITSLLSSLTGSATGSGGTTSPDITSLLSSLTGSASPTTTTSTLGATPNATTQQFLDTALAQNGKPYVWGSTALASDPNPASFDCSELTKWAAARSGVTIPDGAAHQYVWLKQQGATMSVQQALQTPGALLFHFASEPQPGLGGEPPVAHVAISLGNGKTIEAKGHAYGVGIFDAGDRFNYAGMIPGMS